MYSVLLPGWLLGHHLCTRHVTPAGSSRLAAVPPPPLAAPQVHGGCTVTLPLVTVAQQACHPSHLRPRDPGSHTKVELTE